MAQASVKDTTGYVNYVYNISARGTTEVASQLMGMSGMASNILGQLAFQTSSYLSTTEGALLSMGVVATAGLSKATKQAMEFDQALSTIGAISGQTRSEVSDLGEDAMNMSAKFGVAVSEMTEGLESLARAGVSENNMTDILNEAMGLSKLEGLTLDTAINDLISTTNLLDTEGLDLDSPEYADAVKYQNQKITATSEASPIGAQDIIHTLEHIGGYASSTNLDQDDLYAVIAQLGSKGTKSEMAGTSLRAFISAGQKDTAQRALDRIGLNVKDLWKNDDTILSITDMKDVLDEAMEAKGYTQQEKLEFYSDFAGYKQANQIMKIDTQSAREFKQKIDESWDMGSKINQVIGTAETHVQGLIQAGTNLLTKVGEPFLPIISTIAVTLKTGIDIINMIPGSNIIIAGGLILASMKAISTIFNKIVPQIIAAKGNIGGIHGLFRGIREDLSESYVLIKNIKNTDFMKNKAQELEVYHITDRDRINYWAEQKNQHVNGITDVWQFEKEEGFSENDDRYVKWKKNNLKDLINKNKDERNKREGVKTSPKGSNESSNNRKDNKAKANYAEIINVINSTSEAQITAINNFSDQSKESNTLLIENLNQQLKLLQEIKEKVGDIKINDSIIKDLKSHVFKVEIVNASKIIPVHEVKEEAWNKQKKLNKKNNTDDTNKVDSTTPRVKKYIKNFLDEGQVIGEVAKYYTTYDKDEERYQKVVTNAERIATSDYDPRTKKTTPIAPNTIKYRSDYYNKTIGGIQNANKNGYYNELIPYEAFAQEVLGHEKHATSSNIEGYETLLYLTKLFDKAEKSLPDTVKQRMQLIKQRIEGSERSLPGAQRIDEIDKAVDATLPFLDQIQSKFKNKVESQDSTKITDEKHGQTYTLTNLMPIANTDLGYNQNLKKPIVDVLDKISKDGDKEVLSFEDAIIAYAINHNDKKIQFLIEEVGKHYLDNASDTQIYEGKSPIDVGHDIFSKASDQYKVNQAPDALSIPKENLMKLEYLRTGSEAIDELQGWVEQSLSDAQEQMNLKTYSTDFKGSQQQKINEIYKELEIINGIIEQNRVNLQKTNPSETQDMVNVGDPVDTSDILSKAVMKILNDNENLGLDFEEDNAETLRKKVLEIYSSPTEKAQILNDVNSIKNSSLMQSFETMIDATDLDRAQFTKLLINHINENFSDHQLSGVFYQKKDDTKLYASNTLTGLVYGLSKEFQSDEDAVVDFLNSFKEIVEEHRVDLSPQIGELRKKAQEIESNSANYASQMVDDYDGTLDSFGTVVNKMGATLDTDSADIGDPERYEYKDTDDIYESIEDGLDDKRRRIAESEKRLHELETAFDGDFDRNNMGVIDFTAPELSNMTEAEAMAYLDKHQRRKPSDLYSDTNSEFYNPHYRVNFGYNFNAMANDIGSMLGGGTESIFNRKTHSYHLTHTKDLLRGHIERVALLRHELQNIAEFDAQKESGFLPYQRSDFIEKTFGPAYNSRYAHRSSIGKNLVISNIDSPLRAAKYAKYHTMKQNGDDVITGRVIGEEDEFKGDIYLKELEQANLRKIWTTSLGHELKVGIPENSVKSKIRPVFDDLGVPYMFSRYSVGKNSQGQPAYGRMPMQGLFTGVKDAKDLSTHHVMKDESGRFSYIDSPELRLKRLVATNTSNTVKAQGMLATYDPNYELEAAGKEVDPSTSILTPANIAKIAEEQLTPTMKNIVTSMFESQQFTNLEDLKNQTGDNFEEVITAIKDRMNTMGTDGANSVNQFKTWATQDEIDQLKEQNLYDGKKYKTRVKTEKNEEGIEEKKEEYLIFDWAALQRTEDDIAQSFVTSMISRAMLATEKVTELKSMSPNKFAHINKSLDSLPANILKDPTQLLKINNADAINLAGTNSSVLYDVIAALEQLDKINPDELEQYMSKLKIDDIDQEVLDGLHGLGYNINFDETTRTITGVMNAADELVPTFELLYTTLENIVTQSKMIYEMNQIFDSDNVISDKVKKETVKKLAEKDAEQYKISYREAHANLSHNILKNEEAIYGARAVKETSQSSNSRTIGNLVDMNEVQDKYKNNVIKNSNIVKPITARVKENLPPEWIVEPNNVRKMGPKMTNFNNDAPYGEYKGKKYYTPMDILNNALDTNWSFMGESNYTESINMGNVISGQEDSNVPIQYSGYQSGYEEGPFDHVSDLVYNNVLNPTNSKSPLLLPIGSPAQANIPQTEKKKNKTLSNQNEEEESTNTLPNTDNRGNKNNANPPKVIPLSGFGMPSVLTPEQLEVATHYRDELQSSPSRAKVYYGANKIKNDVMQKMIEYSSPYTQKIYEKFGNHDNTMLEKDLNTFSGHMEGVNDKLQGFSSFLQEASDAFPPLIGAVVALDGVIGMITMAQKGVQQIQSFMEIGKVLKSGKDIELFGKTIGPDSELGKMLMSTTGIVGEAFEKLTSIFFKFLGPITLIVAGLSAAKLALDWSYQSHEKYLKSLEEEQKSKRSKAKGLQPINENAQKAARENTAPRQQDRLNRNAQLAQTQVDNANMTRTHGAIELTQAKNDTLWGDYGIASGLGKISGNYESTAQEYEGTTEQIRRIKEETLANPFASDAMKQSAAYYDANQLTFGIMDEYKDELGKLYDSETSAMLKYKSDDVRESPEFQKALDDFVEATGITRDHAKQYLDYMQTEHEVDKATQSMQAQADQISASTELKVQAIAFGGNPADVLGLNGIEAQQDSMIKAQADMIKLELSGQLWWKAVWATISSPFKLLLSPLLVITDLLGAIWSLMTGNWSDAFEKGGRAGSRLNVFGEAATYWGAWADVESTDFNAIGQGATDSYNRANYGNVQQPASGGYHPTHFVNANTGEDRREGRGASNSFNFNGGGGNGPSGNVGIGGPSHKGSYHFVNGSPSQPMESANPLTSGGGILSGIASALSTIIGILTTGLLAGGGIYGIYKFLKSDLSLKDLGGGILKAITGEGSDIFSGIFKEGTWLGKIKDKLLPNFDGIFKEGTLLGKLKDKVAPHLGGVKESYDVRKDQIKDFFKIGTGEEGAKDIFGNLKDRISGIKDHFKELPDDSIQGRIYNKISNKTGGILRDAEAYNNIDPNGGNYPTHIKEAMEKSRENTSFSTKMVAKGLRVKDSLNKWKDYGMDKAQGFMAGRIQKDDEYQKYSKSKRSHLNKKQQNYLVDKYLDKDEFDESNFGSSKQRSKAIRNKLDDMGKWKEASTDLYAHENGGYVQAMGKSIVNRYTKPWREYGEKQYGNLKQKAQEYNENPTEDASMPVKVMAKGMQIKEAVEDPDKMIDMVKGYANKYIDMQGEGSTLGKYREKYQKGKEILSDPAKAEEWATNKYQEIKEDPALQEEYDWYKQGGAMRFGDLSKENKVRAIGDKISEVKQNTFGMEQGESVREVLQNPERTMEVLKTGFENMRENGVMESLGLDEDFGIMDATKRKISGIFDQVKEGITDGIDEDDENASFIDKAKKKIAGFFGWTKEEPESEYNEDVLKEEMDWYKAGELNYSDLSSPNKLKAIDPTLERDTFGAKDDSYYAEPNAEESPLRKMTRKLATPETEDTTEEGEEKGGIIHRLKRKVSGIRKSKKDDDTEESESSSDDDKKESKGIFRGVFDTLKQARQIDKNPIKEEMKMNKEAIKNVVTGKAFDIEPDHSILQGPEGKQGAIVDKGDKKKDVAKSYEERGVSLFKRPDNSSILQGPEGKQGAIVNKDDKKKDASKAYEERGVSLFKKPKNHSSNLVYKEEQPGAATSSPSIMKINEGSSVGHASQRIMSGEDPTDVALDTVKEKLTGGEGGVKGANNALKKTGKITSKVGEMAKGKGGKIGKVGNVLEKVGGGASKAGNKGVTNVAKSGLGKVAKSGVGKAAKSGLGKVAKGGIGKAAKGGLGKVAGKVGGKVLGKVGGKIAGKVGAQVASKVLAGGLAATGVGAPLAAIMASPIGGFLMEGAMDLGGKALGAVGGAVGNIGKAIGGFLGFGPKKANNPSGGMNPLMMASPLGALGAMAGGIGSMLGGGGGGSPMGSGTGGAPGMGGPLAMMTSPLMMGVGLLGSIFKTNKDQKNQSAGIGDIAKRILKNIVDGNKGESGGGNGGSIKIQNININTADDPEAIKAMFLELLIELQEQVNPRLVSRTAGQPPASNDTSSTDTSTETEDQTANENNTDTSQTNSNQQQN